ncbi:hypothetical protein [Candidatus Pelagisphaera phototrophica]|uniref:hypothetical protein n=1 Tax=Candidatus Pelagisphaera phototrophica TaxID=2684113 RepID=UPI001A0C263B|nr:hypothetical protein [Candidatus Pelagisphaera phototrophica]QXD31028.1 hypothetical protein GA004_11825 [Candidatus Pelagisphaera phototrophica]
MNSIDRINKLEDDFMEIDYLVYSAHKTGTQSLVETLQHNDLKSLHLHQLQNLGLKKGDFQKYVEEYVKKNNRKLKILTVFREPMERQISSFFEAYGSEPIRLDKVKDPTETIIYKYSFKQLQRKFHIELATKTLMGYRESIHEICQELGISLRDFKSIDETKKLFLCETESITLHLIEFHELIRNFESILTIITKVPITSKVANMADAKWYKDVYHDFKMSLALPQKLISAIYNDKRGIIDFIYPAGFESKESQAMGKYGKKSKSTFRSYWDYSHLIWIQMKHKITKRMKNIIQDNLR